ncbi:MAG TPA: UDP-N-acetylmuramoyl-tripeptide--D-alanyl-D-alanine ligase [Thermoanaerobaculia bacterium]
MNFTLADVAAAAGAKVPAGAADVDLSGVAVDSRAARPGVLFVALKGERADGHDFAADAVFRGARAVLSQRIPSPLPEGCPVVAVPDPLAAMTALAVTLKDRAGFRLAAVTGSSGKTTTKEFTAAILSRRFTVERTPGNQNSAIGFPMSVVNLPRVPDWMVGEMGMSAKGELSRLSRAFRPDVASITNVAPAHLASFNSIDEVGEAKAEILEGLRPSGTFVANADDSRVAAIAGRWPGRVVRFGRLAKGADVIADRFERGEAETRFRLRTSSDETAVVLPLPGTHQAVNFLAASAIALAAGASLVDCAAAAPALSPSPHRGEFRRHASGALLYDDSYNANPASLRAALDTLADFAATRRIAVLGDMRELGEDEDVWHRELGKYAAERVDRLICVGELARWYGEGAVASGFARAAIDSVDSPEEAAKLLEKNLREGDVVLIKGSRAVGLDRAVELLAVKSERGTRNAERGKAGEA